MKCPKCGYHSFEHLVSCRKCDHDLHEHKAKYKLSGFLTPGAAATTVPQDAADEESAATPVSPENESSDFGFDFLEDDEDRTGAPSGDVSLGNNDHEINLDQPFDVESEIIPVDTPAEDKDRPDKGPEFAF